jgi:hypothetical protein
VYIDTDEALGILAATTSLHEGDDEAVRYRLQAIGDEMESYTCIPFQVRSGKRVERRLTPQSASGDRRGTSRR